MVELCRIVDVHLDYVTSVLVPELVVVDVIEINNGISL